MNSPLEDSVRLPVLAKFSFVPANWLFGDRERIEKAIHAAAEKASGELGNHNYDIDCEFCNRRVSIIERHMREELGL